MSVFCVFGNQVWGTVGGTDLARALLLKKVRAKRPFYKLISERGGWNGIHLPFSYKHGIVFLMHGLLCVI